ncbi:MAG: hypothetical protein Ct9H300mP10_09010 [Methanobacteriota archaeon]|nr:MAG: hypothetical protein Ct9H300mP10_09010 [Euryarchaeota archaeon]
MGGDVHTWDDAYVAGLYGISLTDAAALRSWVKDFMFEEVVGALLAFQYGASAYTTQPIHNWLYGWSDPVLVGSMERRTVGSSLRPTRHTTGPGARARETSLSTR